jgi:chromosomal replication initiator protein
VGFVLQSKYQSIIKKTVEKYLGSPLNLLTFTSEKENIKANVPLFTNEVSSLADRLIKNGLSPHLTFENFAVSPSNQLAHATTLAVANNPGKVYNPLFLWGGVGVGKTHLLNAIGRKVLEDPSKKVFYCSAEDFTNQLINGIKNKDTGAFRRRFRTIDTLLIDDIQFISQREFVQEELFHTFNKLKTLNKQVVFTSDQPPRLLGNIEERLVSRFLSGLVVDIQQPDFELKTAITLIKAQEKDIELDIELAKLVAANVGDIRELEGFILTLSALTTSGIVIGKELVERLVLQNRGAERKAVDAKEIIRATLSEFGIKLKEIREDNRKQSVVSARHTAMYLLKTLTSLPYIDIAKLLGKKDHTTIMHGVQKTIKEMMSNEDLREKINNIKRQFT